MNPTEYLDQLDQAREKATPGPWHWDPKFGEKNDTGLALTNDVGAEIVGAYNTHCCDFRDDPTVEDADAALIVAAVNAQPKLTAALRAVLAAHISNGDKYDEECVACRAECSWCEGDHPWPCPTVQAITNVLGGEL